MRIFGFIGIIAALAGCYIVRPAAASDRATLQLRATVPVICRVTPDAVEYHADGNGADITLNSFCNGRVTASAALISAKGGAFDGVSFAVDGKTAASPAPGTAAVYTAEGPMKRMSSLRVRQDGFAEKHGSVSAVMTVNASSF